MKKLIAFVLASTFVSTAYAEDKTEILYTSKNVTLTSERFDYTFYCRFTLKSHDMTMDVIGPYGNVEINRQFKIVLTKENIKNEILTDANVIKTFKIGNESFSRPVEFYKSDEDDNSIYTIVNGNPINIIVPETPSVYTTNTESYILPNVKEFEWLSFIGCVERAHYVTTLTELKRSELEPEPKMPTEERKS